MANLVDAGLSDFPFRTVPPSGATHLWADRSAFRRDLEDLVQSWTRNPYSGIYLMWADFGAGKTHALRYLQAIAQDSDPPSVAVYCDLPEATSNFLEVYRQVVPQIPEQVLTRAIEGYRKTLGDSWLTTSILAGDRETPRVLWMLAEMGDQLRGEVARRWIRGDRLTSRESALIDYVAPIKTSDRAIRALASICRIILDGGHYSRLLLMFDEFQRIGQVSQRKIHDINAGINTLYNSCPEGLAIVLSYSFGVPEHIKFMVTEEVDSRVERRFSLQTLTELEAQTFVADLIEAYRLEGGPAHPFTESAIEGVVLRLSKDLHGRLTPRLVMQCFSRILDGALSRERSVFPVERDVADELYRAPDT